MSQAPDLVGLVYIEPGEGEKRMEIIKNKNSDIKIVLGGPGVPYDVESWGMLNVHGQIDALMGEEIAFRQL